MNSVELPIGLIPVVPRYVPFVLLAVLEAAAVLAWFLVFTRGRRNDFDPQLWCARCARLHERTEVFGRAADALAVGALAFLVMLPFVAAGYESGLTFANAVLAVSAVAGVVAVFAEADFVARVAAARVWPRLTWSAEPARIVGGGARWLGVILVLYLFQPRDALLGGEAGIAALFGAAGKRLAVDLGSTSAIVAAAVIIAGAFIVALASRWILPLICGSLPTALVPSHEPHGTAT